MSVEIDQSGKIEQLNTPTTVGAANDEKLAIRIITSHKQRLLYKLRGSLIPRNDLYPIMFSILIYLLILKLKKLPDKIIIDEEYSGKEKLIENTIRKLLNRKSIKWDGNILFKQIGKEAIAHDVAWATHSKNKKNKYKSFTTTDSEILKLLY
jgi:hypothetical protein